VGESREVIFVVKVGEKEIPVTVEVLKIINEYIRTPMTLEELAEKLGLSGWEEAYEFIKALPLWVMWTPPSLWEHRRRWVVEKLGSQSKA
jgi:hypothetical protein